MSSNGDNELEVEPTTADSKNIKAIGKVNEKRLLFNCFTDF